MRTNTWLGLALAVSLPCAVAQTSEVTEREVAVPKCAQPVD